MNKNKDNKYKIKNIVKPEYIDRFRSKYNYMLFEGKILTKKELNDIYTFEQQSSNTIFVTLEPVK